MDFLQTANPRSSPMRNRAGSRFPHSASSLLLLLIAVLAPGWNGTLYGFQSKASGDRWFQDVTHKAHIHERHHTRRFNNPYAEIMQGYTKLGAAAAVADYDGDGFEDIFVTDSCTTCKNHLYHNNGDFTFTDVAEQAGVANGNDEENASSGALWFDFNNDGLPDRSEEHTSELQ